MTDLIRRRAERLELREQLAALAHEQWSGWMRHLFSKCHDEAGRIIPEELSWRWRRQMQTPYAELSEAEKNSDREEADRMLAIVEAELRAVLEERNHQVEIIVRSEVARGTREVVLDLLARPSPAEPESET